MNLRSTRGPQSGESLLVPRGPQGRRYRSARRSIARPSEGPFLCLAGGLKAENLRSNRGPRSGPTDDIAKRRINPGPPRPSGPPVWFSEAVHQAPSKGPFLWLAGGLKAADLDCEPPPRRHLTETQIALGRLPGRLEQRLGPDLIAADREQSQSGVSTLQSLAIIRSRRRLLRASMSDRMRWNSGFSTMRSNPG